MSQVCVEQTSEPADSQVVTQPQDDGRMTKSLEQGVDEIARLYRYFATNREQFFAPGVKEAHVRHTLIDPLFEALGWDVRGSAATVAPQYREVIFEDSLEIEGQQKSPDYTFRVGTLAKFYVEAKKCAVEIGSDPAPAFQLRRYGWNAKVGLSILTNFAELGVYDCTRRPSQSDKASRGRILHLHCEEYPDRWRELWDIFSREAVWSGAYDQQVASKRKRGTSEVDAEFLKDIEGWRQELARNIALRNAELTSSDDLTAAVQLTIDRIVFLRMAEDRGLEPYEQLLKLCEQPGIYAKLMHLCRRADDKYNSGLFHFQHEVGVAEPPDRITPKLTIDDKVLRPIVEGLYFSHGSPYHFGVMPVEILGTVYERFLGKVVRLTAGHQARVEEKPEVRKAGGVYYTPAYIVNYIVEHTLGEQIAGRSPAQLAGLRNGKRPFRVLDMACGSGSFLLGAYQHFMDYYLNWYMDNKPQTQKKAVYRDGQTGQWRLKIVEKKRILTTHIFGVDIDPQAVEVTKLSLLLKVLEGESALSMALLPFAVHALPNLAENIKCGNSLISPDYFTRTLIPDAVDLKRINAMDWTEAFAAAMKSGGFDCIIGNPPYVRIQTMKEWAPLEVEAYKELFTASQTGNYDIYVVFIEHALRLLNERGRLGFICPHKFFNSKYGEPLRRVIADGKHLSHVVHFGDQQVFEGATTYTCLLFLDKVRRTSCRIARVDDLARWRTADKAKKGRIKASAVTAAEWNFAVGADAELFAKLTGISTRLGDVSDIFVGLQTSADTVFLFKDVPELIGKSVLVFSKELDDIVPIETALLRPVVRSGSIGRYSSTATAAVLFPYEIRDGNETLIPEDTLRKSFPKAWNYLLRNKDVLSRREHGKFRKSGWYQLYPKNLGVWEQTKILVPYMVTRLSAYFDTEHKYFVNVTTGGFGVVIPARFGDMRYFTGLLNSRLLDWFMKRVSTTFHGGYYAANKQFLVQLPVRTVSRGGDVDHAIAVHDRIVGLVESMQTLGKQFQTAGSAAQRQTTDRQRRAIDKQIDEFVYDLYGLTAKEIAIVEGAS